MSSIRISSIRPVLILLIMLLAACAAPPRPLPQRLPSSGGRLETLRSMVAMSVTSAGKSMNGRGYLLYRSPDRFRLGILAPFGVTLLDIYAQGEQAVIVVPARGTAYRGRFSDLESGAVRGWRLMRLAMDAELLDEQHRGATVRHIAADGTGEELYYNERGLLQRKETNDGIQVDYAEYRDEGGIALPTRIEFRDGAGTSGRLSLSEPEVNLVLDQDAFVPGLDGMTVLPLSQFRGL